MASSTATGTALVWFRRDLRLSDNPALHAAVRSGRPLVCVYIHESGTDTALAPGAASRWWLHHSLQRLAAAIGAIGGNLLLRHGEADAVLPALCEEAGCVEVFWNRSDTVAVDARDCALASQLADRGVKARGFRESRASNPGTPNTPASPGAPGAGPRPAERYARRLGASAGRARLGHRIC